jgi:DNA-binding response OmpR family regulator
MGRILVVEDDKLLGKSLGFALKGAGYDVAWATAADQVFYILEQGDIQFVYLDIMLPGDIDGYEILRRMKALDSAHKKIPVVMLSNLGQMSEIDRAMDLGAVDYVIKANIDLDKLVEMTKDKYGIDPVAR